MAVLVPIFFGLLVTLISYWWLKIEKRRNKMKWLPEVPGVPILGNVLELNNPTTILNVFSKYCEKYDGLYTIELVLDKYIVASKPEFVEFLLGKMDVLDKTEPYRFLENWLGSGLLTANASTWKKSRKMLTPSFHFSILEQFIDTFNNNSKILVDILEKQVDKGSFDLFPFVAMSALDIICETAMGVSINAQKNPKSDYVHAVKEKCKLLIERTFSPIKQFDVLYPLTKDYYDELKYVKTLHSYTSSVIKSRKEELQNKLANDQQDKNEEAIGIKKKKVFLDLLFEATIDGRPLTDDEIRQEVDTFMFAGHDTTASAISFTLYCLSNNPDIQDKVIDEQIRIFGEDRYRPVSHRDIQEMKYLELVIKESLRMYPPVPYIGRQPKRDIEYKNGHIIPKGTEILLLIFCANRNPKYFPEPDKFMPSRFEENKNISQYTYLPFSAGPRNCIGQKYAMLEMKTVISNILRNYEIHSSGQDLMLAAETVLSSVNGINIKLKKREIWNV